MVNSAEDILKLHLDLVPSTFWSQEYGITPSLMVHFHNFPSLVIELCFGQATEPDTQCPSGQKHILRQQSRHLSAWHQSNHITERDLILVTLWWLASNDITSGSI